MPFTYEPLLLPRSCNSQSPFCGTSSQCRRETVLSLSGNCRLSRPTRAGESGNSYRRPLSGPCKTRSVSTAPYFTAHQCKKHPNPPPSAVFSPNFSSICVIRAICVQLFGRSALQKPTLFESGIRHRLAPMPRQRRPASYSSQGANCGHQKRRRKKFFSESQSSGWQPTRRSLHWHKKPAT